MATNTAPPHGHHASHSHDATTVTCDACRVNIPINTNPLTLSLYRQHESTGVKIAGGCDTRACAHLCGDCAQSILNHCKYVASSSERANWP